MFLALHTVGELGYGAQDLTAIAVLSVATGVLYELTGGLWTPILAHAACNTHTLLVLMLAGFGATSDGSGCTLEAPGELERRESVSSGWTPRMVSTWHQSSPNSGLRSGSSNLGSRLISLVHDRDLARQAPAPMRHPPPTPAAPPPTASRAPSPPTASLQVAHVLNQRGVHHPSSMPIATPSESLDNETQPG